MNKSITTICAASLLAMSGYALTQTADRAGTQRSGPQIAERTISSAKAPQTLMDIELAPRGERSVFHTPQLAASKSQQAKILQANTELPAIYGSVMYQDGWSEQNAPVGLYNVSTSSPSLLFNGPYSIGGGVLMDGIYYFVDYVTFLDAKLVTVHGVDITSGYEEWRANGTNDSYFIGGMALDPISGEVYGISYDAAGENHQFAKISFTPVPKTTAIAQLEGKWCAFAISSNGTCYGIRKTVKQYGNSYVCTESKLCKIDRNTGAVTEVGVTGQMPHYISHACIDPRTDKMYWCVNPYDGSGYLCEVDLATGHATKVVDYEKNDEIVGMYVPVPEADNKAPGYCKAVSSNFTDNSLSGSVSLTTPLKNYDGSNGTDMLTMKIYINSEEVASQKAEYGEQVTIPVTLSKGGVYDIVVYAENAAGRGPKSRLKYVWIGGATPRTPQPTISYANGKMNVSWEPITASIRGTEFNSAGVKYRVVRQDGSLAANDLTATTFTEDMPMPTHYTEVSYTVYAYCDGLISEGGSTELLGIGAKTPPYATSFATTGFDGMTIIDANKDGKTWKLFNGKARADYHGTNKMDDWLILPAVRLEAGKTYRVKFSAHAGNERFKERIEVKYGNAATAEAMTNTLVEPTEITNEVSDFTQSLIADEDGVYYIGFHGISDKNMLYLYLNDITVEDGISALAPKAVTDLTATPGAYGALSCTLSFKAPELLSDESRLDAISKIEVYRGETLIKTIDNPTPGSTLSVEDNVNAVGEYEYTVYAYAGNEKGMPASVKIYIGVYFAEAPQNVRITTTDVDGEVLLSWDAVTTDKYGNPLRAEDVSYNIYLCDGPYRTILKPGHNSTSYTFKAVEEGQDYVQCSVFSATAAGEGDGEVSSLIPVGKAYAGMEESFADGKLHYLWSSSNAGGGNWNICNDATYTDMNSQDNDDGYIAMTVQYLEQYGALATGLISLENIEHPGLTFYTYNITNYLGYPDNNVISVAVREDGSETWNQIYSNTVNAIAKEVGSIWAKGIVDLSAYAGKKVQLMFVCTCQSGFATVALDRICVRSVFDKDLEAKSIDIPAVVKTGTEFTVGVQVVNNGSEPIEDYSVELYCDGALAESKKGVKLAVDESHTYDFACSMSAVSTEPHTYYAVVVYADDENNTNNSTKSVTVSPELSDLPKPLNVLATPDADKSGVTLSWNEPDFYYAESKVINEDFESGERFADHYGDWTFVDRDMAPASGFGAFDIPCIVKGETLGSFWVWDTAWSYGNAPNADSFKAHSGFKYLFSMFRADYGTLDDWAISPELSGNAQTISFYARTYNPNYPEKVEVYYSTGSLNPNDFIKLEDVGGEIAGGLNQTTYEYVWQYIKADLPKGAKYFAIRSCAQNSFMLMIDDVTYECAPLPVELQLVGYNLYRDGLKLNESVLEETRYHDSSVEQNKKYSYSATAVYVTRGESAGTDPLAYQHEGAAIDQLLKNCAVYAESGHIVVTNAEGCRVSVYNANGVQIFTGAGEQRMIIPAECGAYIVKTGQVYHKLIVR